MTSYSVCCKRDIPKSESAATSMGLRAGELVEPSTPLWYMLIAITPRVRYRAGARCPAWRATELRQLCANLVNSNLTGSHLPPLVRAARPPYLVRQVVPPGIELYRRSETARGCTRSCAGGHRQRSCVCMGWRISLRAGAREIGESVCWKKQITAPRVLKWYFTEERGEIPRVCYVCVNSRVQEDY